jgi:homoserine acetyltransferase
MPILKSALAVLLTFVAFYTASAQQAQVALPIQQGDYIAHDFKFGTGETLHELRLHYRTLGQPKRDASGHVSNAVLILHGTGGTGAQFLGSQFAGVLFEPGQLLDAAKYSTSSFPTASATEGPPSRATASTRIFPATTTTTWLLRSTFS